MLFGKSELHVNQPVGSFIDSGEFFGYYNDLSNKVLQDKSNVYKEQYLPIFTTDDGEKVYFPIQIAQYGLGCYELFLKTHNDIFKRKMLFCSNYLINILEPTGGINCMFFVKNLYDHYSSMCQGECISLFLRAYHVSKKQVYLESADKAFSFLTDSNNNLVDKNGYFYEYQNKPLVLNGFIFSIFGIYDYYLIKKDSESKLFFDMSISSLIYILPKFVCEQWSYYDLGGSIASKFYHKLHIELLKAIEIISGLSLNDFIDLWNKSLKDKKISRRMFWKKAKQKMRK